MTFGANPRSLDYQDQTRGRGRGNPSKGFIMEHKILKLKGRIFLPKGLIRFVQKLLMEYHDSPAARRWKKKGVVL